MEIRLDSLKFAGNRFSQTRQDLVRLHQHFSVLSACRYLEAKKDRVTVVFSTVFKDDDDVIIGKVFMQVCIVGDYQLKQKQFHYFTHCGCIPIHSPHKYRNVSPQPAKKYLIASPLGTYHAIHKLVSFFCGSVPNHTPDCALFTQ